MKRFLYKFILARYYHILFGTNMPLQELDLTGKKCLCLAPHPDDESIGMGGTLAKYNENIDVICLTDGSRAGSTLSKEELIKKRAHEFNNAMKIGRVKNHKMLNMPDKQLIVNAYDNQVDISEYDYIFISNLIDQHRDHKSVSAYLNLLLKKKHKKELKIAFYEVWQALALPNYFVDISDVKDIKRDMINAHESQVEDYDYTNKALALNFYRGLSHKREYAESFMVMDIKMFRKILRACSII